MSSTKLSRRKSRGLSNVDGGYLKSTIVNDMTKLRVRFEWRLSHIILQL